MEVRGKKQTLTAFETPVVLLWLMRQTLIIPALMNCRGVWLPHLFLCVAVPLIARVAVRFVTSYSLEVVTRLQNYVHAN